MKKSLLLLFAALLLGTFTVQAQKYGHINPQAVFDVMPGTDSIKIKFEAFQNELREYGNTMVADLQAKTAKFDQEAGTMSQAVRKLREQELIDLQNRIQEFQNNAQNDLQAKQIELMQPFEDKIKEAITAVSKENGFTYVFEQATLVYADGGEDITPLVKKKLGILK